MKAFIGLFTVAAALLAMASPVAAQVAFPQSPADLVAMANSDLYLKDLDQRAFVQKAMAFAVARETNASSKPYTTAIQSWLSNVLNNDGRIQHMFGEQLAATTITDPIDLYILAGQSNMVGLTESGGYNGPDPEIRAALQARTPGRRVVTLNCAFSATSSYDWVPSSTSFTHLLLQKLYFNPARECVEFARGIKNKNGKRARIRGVFFYQGEADVNWALYFKSDAVVTSWPDRYREIIDFWRDEFGEIPAVHAQIATTSDPSPETQHYWKLLQDTQAAVPSHLSRSAVIVTKDLQVRDGVHLNDASQAIAGQRFATAMIGLL
jgi:hypothetical protein